MQFKVDMTADEIKNDIDPLHHTCHPLGKLNFVAEIIFWLSDETINEPFSGLKADKLYSMGEIISDAVEDLELIIGATNERFNELVAERDSIAEKLKALIPADGLARELKVNYLKPEKKSMMKGEDKFH